MALNLKGNVSQSFQGKLMRVIWVYGASKLRAARPVNYFPEFLGKNIKNCPPSKLFLFASPGQSQVIANNISYQLFTIVFMLPLK